MTTRYCPICREMSADTFCSKCGMKLREPMTNEERLALIAGIVRTANARVDACLKRNHRDEKVGATESCVSCVNARNEAYCEISEVIARTEHLPNPKSREVDPHALP